MTREEAIRGLETLSKYFSGYKPNEEMFDMAISALKAQDAKDAKPMPSQLPSGDTIYRQDAIDLADKITERDTSGNNDVVKAMSAWKECIKGLPSVQPETCEGCKHMGKWEDEVEYGYPSPCTRCKRRAVDRYER